MLTLAELPEGQPAKVVRIEGGAGCVQRLNGLGIREGIAVKKIRGLFTHGPIIVRAGRTEIALGRGMASRVIVKAI
jgi:ferrous iron transport protein A